MKVLQLCSAEGIGGGEAHVADLARALVDRGIEVELVVRPSSELPEYLGSNAERFVWHRLPLRNSLDLLSIRGLSALVASRRIDVVHAHLARDYPIAALASRKSRARLVLTRHHYLPIKGNVLYRMLLARATIIAVSESVRDTTLASLRLPPEQVVTIPNWIDLERFDAVRDRVFERRLRAISRRVAVGVIGQLVPLKGQEEFVRAAALVAEERLDVEFVIIGTDRERGEPFKRKLEALARTLGVAERVRLLGHEADLPGALAALDIVAVPSWNEAFSLVTAEAQAAGCAVVASRIGALTDLVADGVTGLLVEPRDPRSLADAIIRLTQAPALAEQLGRRARASAERFARNPRIDDVVALYDRVLAEAPV